MASIKRGIVSLLSSQVLSTILFFIISVYNTRILGPVGKGEFSIFFNANSLYAMLASFSLGHAVIYFSANGQIPIGKLFVTIGSFFAFLSLFCFGSLQFLEQVNLSNLIFPANHSSLFDQFSFSFLLFLNLYCNYITCFLNGKKHFIAFSTSYFIPSLIGAIWYASIYYGGWEWIGLDAYSLVVYTTILTSCIHLILAISFFYRYIGIKQEWRFCNWQEIQQIISFVSFVYLTNLVQFLTFKIDLWFVDFYLTKDIVGIYSLAVSLAQLLWIIPQTIGNV
ncbi:MAG: oligosaccharide flippase family protein, partial [Bacteroidia bacterium]|nr:oligosaccharide flippase family protein [Bacteroidia bacterium]